MIAFVQSVISKPRGQRGDTIVEVMFALAVLGAVLGGAYVVVSRNVITNQSSQERLQAIKIAEAQFERLKIRSVTDTTIFSKSNFCLTPTNTDVISSDSACRVNGSGSPVVTDPSYTIVITKVADVSANGNPQAGTRFKITVSWASIRNTGADSLDYLYEVYR